jgi:hypothetical protein
MRVARAFDVIKRNPGWFLGVMVQRAASMLRLERAKRISTHPPVKHYGALAESERIWQSASAESNSEMTFDARTLSAQVDTSPVSIKRDHEYVLRVPAMVKEGRISITVVGAESNQLYASGILEKAEVKDGTLQPTQVLELPFVGGGDETVAVFFRNSAADSQPSIVILGATEMYELGAASFVWTRNLRLPINGLQRLFITAVMLPLALVGAFVLIRRRAFKTLLLLLSVPAYYLCFQSLLHTEYRYVLAVHYFLFILVGVAIYEAGRLASNLVRSRRMKLASSTQT